jgi:hypothetical protein
MGLASTYAMLKPRMYSAILRGKSMGKNTSESPISCPVGDNFREVYRVNRKRLSAHVVSSLGGDRIMEAEQEIFRCKRIFQERYTVNNESCLHKYLSKRPRHTRNGEENRIEDIDGFWDVLLILRIAGNSQSVAGLSPEQQVAAALFFEKYENRIYRFLLRQLGNESFASDVCQDWALAIIESAKNFSGESKVSGSGANLIIMDNPRHDSTLFREARTLQRPSFQPSSLSFRPCDGMSLTCDTKSRQSL